MLGNFVFDIDECLALAITRENEKVEKAVREKMGDAYFERHCLMAHNYPHYVFPGYYALFKWLYNKGGKLFFFSSGIEARNIELTEKFIKRCFGETANEVDYKVFSRKHCIDTRSWKIKNSREKYQSYYFGNKKKVLTDIVVPEAEMANTLLIDDDKSYMPKGEEYNFVKVKGAFMYLQGEFKALHKACYLAGLLTKIFEIREEKGISLVEAAKIVQMDFENQQISREFYYPSVNRVSYYVDGLEILQKIEPGLKFYYDLPKDGSPY